VLCSWKIKRCNREEHSEDNTQSASSFTTKVNLNFDDDNGYKSEDGMTNNFSDTNIFLRENIIIENESRLKIYVDESNNVLLEKEKYNWGFKIQNFWAQIKGEKIWVSIKENRVIEGKIAKNGDGL
jgi:hypothetical protein